LLRTAICRRNLANEDDGETGTNAAGKGGRLRATSTLISEAMTTREYVGKVFHAETMVSRAGAGHCDGVILTNVVTR
jgi:hypothetical protein